MNESIEERISRLTREVLTELQLKCSCHVASADRYPNRVATVQVVIACPQHGVREGFYFLDVLYDNPQSIETDQSIKEKLWQGVLKHIQSTLLDENLRTSEV